MHAHDLNIGGPSPAEKLSALSPAERCEVISGWKVIAMMQPLSRSITRAHWRNMAATRDIKAAEL